MIIRPWSASALAIYAFVSLLASARAQESGTWHDPSPHTVQFITVDTDVWLEVLDWGGAGRSLGF